MTEYYNKRVKLKRLNIGDLVLRKITSVTKDSLHSDQIGKALQGCSLLKTMELSLGINGWEEIAASMEH